MIKGIPLKKYKISNKFTVQRLMSMLDKEKLQAVKNEFELHPQGLTLHKFILFSYTLTT